MFNLLISIVACGLIVILFFSFKKFGINAFPPMNIAINIISLNKNILKFKDSEKESNFLESMN